MKRLRFLNSAIEDLKNQRKYVEQDSPQAARELVARLEDKCWWLARVGFVGVDRSHLWPGLRMHPYEGRCIFFLDDPECLSVVRILHHAQDEQPSMFNVLIDKKRPK